MMAFIIFWWSVKVCLPIQHRNFGSISLHIYENQSHRLEFFTFKCSPKYISCWSKIPHSVTCKYQVTEKSTEMQALLDRLSEAGNRKLIKAQRRVVCCVLCFIVSKWSFICAVSVKYHAASIINSNLHEFIPHLWEFKMGFNFHSSISPGAGFKVLLFSYRSQQRENIEL